MSDAAPQHVETTADGPRTKRWTLHVADYSELATFRLARMGIDETQAPYRRVRLQPEGSFFLASLEGEGRILLEGKWVAVKAGEIVMAPPRVLNVFFTPPGKKWDFAWMRYDEPTWVRPLAGVTSPLRLASGAEDLGRIMLGLRSEWLQARDPAAIHHWLNLAHTHARRLTSAWHGNEKLWELWQEVTTQLDVDWTLDSLAAKYHVSPEHLRRLCRHELGRSPMEHLTFIRMQRAQELLTSSEDKLETIAKRVGYRSATVFSRAFVRSIGMQPSAYRPRV
jgi:AraC-like DNA-binding protein